MEKRSLAIVAALFVLGTVMLTLSTAVAQAEDWRHIDSSRAGKSRDKDKISVNREYSELKLRVSDIGIVFHKVTVVYEDGHEGPWPIRPFIAKDSESGTYKVRHRPGKIKAVLFDYETRDTMNVLAWGKVDLYGR